MSNTLGQSGDIILNGWVHMMFVVQGYFGALLGRTFGFGPAVLQSSVFVIGVLGLVAVYGTSRFLLSPGYSVLVLALTGLSPLWLYLSETFMTDVPAWTLATFSTVLGTLALKKEQPLFLVPAAVFAMLGFGIREYAIVPFFALLLWTVISSYPIKLRRWATALGVLVVGSCVAAYLWRQSLAGSVETSPSSPFDAVVLTSRLMLSLCLLLAPYLTLAVVVLWPRRSVVLACSRRHWLGASIGMVAGIGVIIPSSLQLVGNVIHPYGSSWTSVGDGVRSVPADAFRGVSLVGALSLLVLFAGAGVLIQAGITTRAWRFLAEPQNPGNIASLNLFIGFSVLAISAVSIFVLGAPAFDRYLILVVPLFGIAILWLATRGLKEPVSKWKKGAVAGILVVTGAFGIIAADGLNQVDGLRWQVASELVESGIPAYKIDGGDAWFRYHQKDAPGVEQVGSLENSIPGRTWWQTFFKGSTFCRMVAIESETDLQAMYGPALSIQDERTLLGTPFRVMVFPGPDPC